MSATTVATLAMLACLAAVHCSPIKGFEERLTNRINFSGPGSSKHFADNLDSDYLVRQVRKDSSRINVFEPYLMFKTPPPVEVTLPANSKYVLECEVSGTPKPAIHWLKNGAIFNQQTSVALEDVSRIGQLALSLVKSRIFLDCLTETPAPIIYTCVAETDFSKIESSTTVKVVRPEQQIDSNGNFFNKEAEFYANQNSIDLSSKPDSLYAMESTLTGCLSKQSLGSPARINFWTLTTLENIGSSGIISCRAIGYPAPSISWFGSSNEALIPDHRKYQILSTGDLLIRNITFDDMGKYKCVAKNAHGTDSVDKIFFYPTEPNQK